MAKAMSLSLSGHRTAPLRGALRLAGRSRSAGAPHASRNPGFALSRNLARAGIRANPASLVKHPG